MANSVWSAMHFNELFLANPVLSVSDYLSSRMVKNYQTVFVRWWVTGRLTGCILILCISSACDFYYFASSLIYALLPVSAFTNLMMYNSTILRVRYWGRENMTSVVQTTFSFSNAFSWMKRVFFIQILLKFVPKGPIDNKSAMSWIKAWRQIGDNPLSEPRRNQDA